MMKKGIAVIIEDPDGKFLLHLRDANARRMKNEWCLVGGQVEQDESLESAAKREVFEETNLEIRQLRGVDHFTVAGRGGVMIFHGRIDDPENLRIQEGADMRFFKPWEALELIESLNYSNPYLESLVKYIYSHEN